MADKQGTRDIVADVMAQGKKTTVPILAEMLKREKIARVPAADERALFWTRALTPEEEQAKWQELMGQQGIVGPMTPEQQLNLSLEVSKHVYPQRWDAMRGAGRSAPSEQAMWANGHAKKGPPATDEGVV